ncbi:MAG: hypothetical protein KGJ90_02020, partial [Patescibacteria group bacterium]|nr:hypothetical protein [Patescibacteria group bacterium]
LPDGSKRGSDNWKAGMAKGVYLASAWRHFLDVWLHHEGCDSVAEEKLEDALCGVLFNIQGYFLEVLKDG